MKFTKMQGCGNDYVYVNGMEEKIPPEKKPELVRRLSDRHFGIGGDGVIFINASVHADFEMEMYNADGIEKTIEYIKQDSKGLIFTNLVDFDMLYGHRNNVKGYSEALEYFDGKLAEIMKNMKDDDMLIITADHGNDPTTPSTDHSREYTPILVYGKQIKPNTNLGIRKTYADISATILDLFNLSKLKNGTSFKNEILK